LVGRNVLLTGLCDAGKTLIYARLVHTKYAQTHTSVKENIGDAFNFGNNKCATVVDIPGHERLRYKYFDQYKSSAKGIVFVIDSSTIQKDIRDVAEYLYTLLSEPSVKKIFLYLFFAINKIRH